MGFMIKGQRSDTDAPGVKLLYVFNKEDGNCYIKHYHQIPQTVDATCAVCPQDVIALNDHENIKAALDKFLGSLKPL